MVCMSKLLTGNMERIDECGIETVAVYDLDARFT
jgi:hypothetical protein